MVPEGSLEASGEEVAFDIEKRSDPPHRNFTFLVDFGVILGSNNHEKSCFFRTSIFYKKKHDFLKSCSRCSETLTFEASGSILEVPRTDQNRKK